MTAFRAFIKQRIKSFAPRLVLAAGLLLPAVFIYFFQKPYHTSDVDDFWRWSQAWGANWRTIYIDCDRCNYPFLGTMLSGGVMDWMGKDDFKDIVAPFRYYLVFVDGLNVLAAWFVMKNLKIANAPFWAGVIGLLPSSWFGTSVWGQMDGIGQFLIFLFFILLVWFNARERTGGQHYLFVSLAALLLSFMLLTKQLVYFSLLALGLILLANIAIYWRKPREIGFSILLAAILFVLPIAVIDLNLSLKQPYVSHLQYILATGSRHGDTISSVGFNIWVFLADDLLGSSHAPLPIRIGSTTPFSITPYPAGVILFLALTTFFVFRFAKHIWENAPPGARRFQSRTLLLLFVFLALVNLSFNLTLTGTHERYLYHFYPFIIIACLGLMGRSKWFNRVTLSALLVGASFYGGFLYAYLNLLVRTFSKSILEVVSLFHLILFGYLVYITLKQLDDRSVDRTGAR